ncbi:MAG: heavy metal translocating P-type ATPase metal-binding domain-containing protein [Acidobacteriota bacterium]
MLPADRDAEQTAAGCAHCGLPVPAGLIRAGEPRQFCCEGCRTVWGILHDEGLARWYALREASGAEPRPARVSGRSYEEFDDPAFAELHVRAAPGGLLTCELYLEGVHCAACVWLVERLPRLVDGAVAVRLDVGRARARVTWDPTRTRLSAIARQLDRLGYPAHPFLGAEVEARARREDRGLLVRVGVAGAVAGNVMLIAVALYGGMFSGIDPALETFFRWASLVLTVPAVTWCASVFHRGALGALRARTLHMDVPVSLGIAAGFGWGAVNTVAGRGEIYFDSVTTLVFLLLVGRWLLRRQQRAAAGAAELLHALSPSVARLVADDGSCRDVPVASLVPGMRVEVRAGETIPADGAVVEGRALVDRALMTGETVPVPVGPGDEVEAGTVDRSGRLVLEVRAAGARTRLGRLLALVEEHARRKAPVVQLADRLSAWFVAAVLLLAATTFALWVRTGVGTAVDHAIALLIVTCPCALGLATPLAVSAAIGRAARAGLLVKGGDAIERVARPGVALLDKTGTLTEGRLEVVRWAGDEAVRPLVARLEACSAHPIARALAGADTASGSDASLPAEVRESTGAGISGRVDGRALVVGAPEWVVRFCSSSPPEWFGPEIERATASGCTPVAVAADGAIVALAILGEPLRPGAKELVSRLRRHGYRVRLLSGDHPRTVRVVAARLGIAATDALGGASPEDKLRVVERAARKGHVVMVGDGVNDAAALAAASAGVAIHGGSEAALAAADVYVTRPDLRLLDELFVGARRTLAVVRRNLAFSLVYNVVGAGLAMAGYIHPLLAALLMPASSLTVIVSSYRARTFREPAERDTDDAD